MRRDLVADVRLYLVTGASDTTRDYAAFLAAVIEAGVGMVQLREKGLTDKKLIAVARVFAEACRDNGALFIVNDRIDVALLSGADGAHLGQDDAQPDAVRRIVGSDFIIGLSTHTPEQVDAANKTSADYIGVGPIHETPTKPGRLAVGLDLVRYAARAAQKPFFAIGGIDRSNAASVIDAGAQSISVLRAISGAADPAAATRELLAAMTRVVR
ncbi:MAG: thiamine phosphate synthase [Candidatus Eremiobacterales bacterium]